MGWAGGTEIAMGVWDAVADSLNAKDRERVAQDIIICLWAHDWDTTDEAEELCEAAGITYDKNGEMVLPPRLKKAMYR